MAEAVVCFAVERLEELLISEANLLDGVSDQINDIKCELKGMQCLLKEADKKQNQDERVRQWVSEMRELAFQTEDVIETFVANKKQQETVFMETKLQNYDASMLSRHNIIVKEMDAIKAKLTDLTQRLLTYGFTKSLEEGETSSNSLKSLRISDSKNEKKGCKHFVGMEKEIEKLIADLKDEDKGCKVVSIYGMAGGQGKTTLAKQIYNHVQVRAHFKAFAWACITQQFDREKVLKNVLRQLLPADRGIEVSWMDDAKLIKEFYQVQQEKNCLIVIDDMRTVEYWRILNPAFPVGETTSGSKILLTTRNATVAKIGSICRINPLSEEESWQLLCKKAGLYDLHLPEEKVAPEMERIGRDMVKRCTGLPLGISLLGGILKGKYLLREWESMNKDISFYLANDEGVINDDEYHTVRQVLRLSYDSLPPRLRHCFLCLAYYEEGEDIETEELYMIWMAEGLISMEDKAEREMMLDVAERYLDKLADRSLVQVQAWENEGMSWSKYKTCHVHDLIRYLCLSKVKEEKVIEVIHLQHQPGGESKANMVRRLCIRSCKDGDELMLQPYDQHVISHIRSIFVWKDKFKSTEVEWPDKILSLEKFKLLRVLTARRYKLTTPGITSISELIYLKYLCLRYCTLEDAELPSSIGNLRYLETLDLRVPYIMGIPNVLWKLKHLKHLYIPMNFTKGGRSVEKLRLEGLNELELIDNYSYVSFDAHELLQLPRLKVFNGSIRVKDKLTAENIIDFITSRELRYSNLIIRGEEEEEVFCLVSLLECCFIDELSILHTRICKFPKEYDHTRFSTRLTTLFLEDSRMEEDPMILLEKLPNLRYLNFFEYAYWGEEMVCTATGFPQLQQLLFRRLHRLRKWRVDEGAMPNLSSLRIYKCPRLEMLPEGLRYLNALETLDIEVTLPAFKNRIKDEDGGEGEDFYKVAHIPNLVT